MSGRGLAASRRSARQLALAAVFEAEFGQRTAERALDRQLAATEVEPDTEAHARELVSVVTRNRADLDEIITRTAPAYPVMQLARIDRSLLRLALGELLHCPATPAGVAISEWVELAKSYSGEPAKRLLNGVAGRVATEARGNEPAPVQSGRGRKGGS
jgi:transcription antitermination protein NusB